MQQLINELHGAIKSPHITVGGQYYNIVVQYIHPKTSHAHIYNNFLSLSLPLPFSLISLSHYLYPLRVGDVTVLILTSNTDPMSCV